MCIKAFELGGDIVVFPEMSVCGYPPEDLLLKEQFLNDNRLAVEYLAKNCPDITIIAGFAEAGWTTDSLAYENLQARIRGCILMSLSNQYGFLVLTTSNKSETAVGYATLY